jgi:uncharacterized glyoxalase superfamily protein PhnB
MSQTVFPTFKYADAHGAIDWLERVLGAERIAEHADGDRIAHAEIRIGESAVMLGSLDGGRATAPGHSVTYVVVEDADAAYRRAVDAGGRVSGEPVEQPYGSRDFSVTDPEGNVWALGTYKGAGG